MKSGIIIKAGKRIEISKLKLSIEKNTLVK